MERRRGVCRSDHLHHATARSQLEAFTEPMSALVTLPFACVGELAWNLAWFAYIPIAAFLRRRGTKGQDQL